MQCFGSAKIFKEKLKTLKITVWVLPFTFSIKTFKHFNKKFFTGKDLSSKMSLWPKKSRSLGDLIDVMSPSRTLFNLENLFGSELLFWKGGWGC